MEIEEMSLPRYGVKNIRLTKRSVNNSRIEMEFNHHAEKENGKGDMT